MSYCKARKSVKLQPLTGLKGKLVINKKKRIVKLKWNKIHDPNLAGYKILLDRSTKGQFTIQSQIPLIKHNNFNYDFDLVSYDREYTFRVTPFSKKSAFGQYQDYTVFVPSNRIIGPYNLQGKFDLKGNINFTWDCKPFKSLKGFRLFLNGKMMVDEKNLKPDMRSYLFSKTPDELVISRKNGTFKLYAVGAGEIVNEIPVAKTLTLSRKPLLSVPSPENFKIDKNQKDNKKALKFSWKNIDYQKRQLAGVKINLINPKTNFTSSISGWPNRTGSFLWIIPEKFKNCKKLTFQYYFNTSKGNIGQKSEINYDLTGE